jgi:hypothetical protein
MDTALLQVKKQITNWIFDMNKKGNLEKICW